MQKCQKSIKNNIHTLKQISIAFVEIENKFHFFNGFFIWLRH